MVLLFAENGSIVSGFDKSSDITQGVVKMVHEEKSVSNDVFIPYNNLADFVAGFKPEQPRIIVLSLPHGTVADGVLDELRPHLQKGDVIMYVNKRSLIIFSFSRLFSDFDNEWWKRTGFT
jgi:6-phosphogluconate dehydrogenase